METVMSLMGILAVLLVGVISPGPSFLLVARTAVGVSRAAGVASALGMAIGAMVLALLALLGLHALLIKLPLVYLGLKVVGGLYLLYLGLQIWRGARAPLAVDATSAAGTADRTGQWLRHFLLGAGTMLGNPKAIVQYGVIFAALLPASPSLALSLTLPPAVLLLEGGWYLLVALALSAAGPRQRYLRAKTTLDRLSGAVLALLGVRLLLSDK